MQLTAVKCSEMASDIESLRSLGLSTDSPLATSIHECVVRLASGHGVLSSVQNAAQSLLTVCWPILLPTTDERVVALSALIESTAVTAFTHIIISYCFHFLLPPLKKEVMFLVRSVCLSVCLFVCLSVGLLANL